MPMSLMTLGVAPVAPTGQQPAACEILDLTPRFLSFWDATRDLSPAERLARFRTDVMPGHEDLYGPAVRVGADPARLDDDLRAWFRHLARDDADLRAASLRLREEIPRLQRRLPALLPDFRCDARAIIYFSAGAFDGAVREVDGRPTLLFGIEVAARSQPADALGAFVAHEMFHLHHRAVTGAAMDGVLYGRLWREGLATLFGHLVAPAVPEDVLLGWPRDLAAQAAPRSAELAAMLLGVLDSTEEAVMQAPLLANASGDLPPRYGYYIAYRIAQELAPHHTLAELVRLDGPPLRAEMARALQRMASVGAR